MIGTKLTRSDKAEVFDSQVIVKYQQVYIGTDLWMPEMVQTKTI